jgi:hypothetical protein
VLLPCAWLAVACSAAGASPGSARPSAAASATMKMPAPSAPVATGGATIDRPFHLQVTGASCESNSQNAAGAFPAQGGAVLGWSIGPAAAAQVKEANPAPFTGPGTYSGVLMSGQNPNTKQLFGGPRHRRRQ